MFKNYKKNIKKKTEKLKLVLRERKHNVCYMIGTFTEKNEMFDTGLKRLRRKRNV